LKSFHIPENAELDQEPGMAVLSDNRLIHKMFFFYCGNARSHKNLEFIINIFNSNPDLPPLVLAGKGHKHGANVIVAGVVSNSALKALYMSATAFIFPSKYEGFGLPILESLHAKTPVIASNISAFLEFNTKNISFFELNDERAFLTVVRDRCVKNFVEEPGFFEKFSKEQIYKLNDSLILRPLIK
jgi:glycosyltransferase involved in cell wall biosynthesis